MGSLPALRVDNVRKAFDDGNHDAFTDLCSYRGRLWLTCRSCPDGHMVFTSSRIIVLVSDDGQQWHEVFSFSVAGRDTRDPHFLVFGDQLFVYTGTWLVPGPGEPRNLNDHLGYAVWTADGVAWSGPRSLEGTYGHYIWRAAAIGGRAYLCGRRRRDFVAGLADEAAAESIESAMLESDDGLIWRFRSRFVEAGGDETAFVFGGDGSVLAIARGADAQPAQVCRAHPPYAQWQRHSLDRNVGGPLLARWGEHLLVAGRRTLPSTPAVTAIYWLAGDALHEVALLPSSGDNSYPGLVPLTAERALFSYYSSHEGSTSVYLADLSLG